MAQIGMDAVVGSARWAAAGVFVLGVVAMLGGGPKLVVLRLYVRI